MKNSRISSDSIDMDLENIGLSNPGLADNQVKILHLIKKQGDITAAQISQQIEMTSMGARQHLETLETRGYIKHLFKKAGRGRPKKYWQISNKGQSQFPDGHAHLIVNLLDLMKDQFGTKAVDRLIISRESDMLQVYETALDPIPMLADKLDQLAKIRTTEGYMAHIEETHNGWLLIEDHCPICSAASQCQQFCRSEKKIFESVLQANVVRTDYILQGDRRCCYEISVQNPQLQLD